MVWIALAYFAVGLVGAAALAAENRLSGHWSDLDKAMVVVGLWPLLLVTAAAVVVGDMVGDWIVAARKERPLMGLVWFSFALPFIAAALLVIGMTADRRLSR